MLITSIGSMPHVLPAQSRAEVTASVNLTHRSVSWAPRETAQAVHGLADGAACATADYRAAPAMPLLPPDPDAPTGPPPSFDESPLERLRDNAVDPEVAKRDLSDGRRAEGAETAAPSEREIRAATAAPAERNEPLDLRR